MILGQIDHENIFYIAEDSRMNFYYHELFEVSIVHLFPLFVKVIQNGEKHSINYCLDMINNFCTTDENKGEWFKYILLEKEYVLNCFTMPSTLPIKISFII